MSLIFLACIVCIIISFCTQMKVDRLCPNILLRSEPWRQWLKQSDLTHPNKHSAVASLSSEMSGNSSVADVILCIYVVSSVEAWERWGSHTHDTEAQLDYTLCLSASITSAVHTASQRCTEASHFCDISSRLDVNESLIEMQTHGLSSFIIWVCVYAYLKSAAASLSRWLASSTRSCLNTFNTFVKSLFKSYLNFRYWTPQIV